jgi:hypothetical protein
MATPFRVVPRTAVMRVHTLRGVQVHRGFHPTVYFAGQREPVLLKSFHQKRKGAIEVGERYARKVLRERAAAEQGGE